MKPGRRDDILCGMIADCEYAYGDNAKNAINSLRDELKNTKEKIRHLVGLLELARDYLECDGFSGKTMAEIDDAVEKNK